MFSIFLSHRSKLSIDMWKNKLDNCIIYILSILSYIFCLFTFGSGRHFELMVINTSQKQNKTYVLCWDFYIKHNVVLYHILSSFCDQIKWIYKKIDLRKSLKITSDNLWLQCNSNTGSHLDFFKQKLKINCS